ncbi:aldose 1-epimerase family protein [Streptomyces sp. NPDC055709]
MSARHGTPSRARPSRRAVLTAGTFTGLGLLSGATPFARASWDHPAPEGLSGEQYEISRGRQTVVVTELGAALRSVRWGRRELLDTFPPDSYPTGASYGQLLIPWPNRIDHGTYVFDGVTQELPWSEPAQQNAIHGLTRWMNWQAVEHRASRLVMGLTLHAQPGYPFVLRLRQTYELTERGLVVTNEVHNLSDGSVPYGVGMHPYFTLGTEFINDIVLELPARSYFRTNPRSIPLPPPVSVDGTPFDFRRPRPLGNTVMDTGFADLIRHGNGEARVHMTSPESRVSLTVWLDRQHEFLQVYTGDTLPNPARRRRGLAIEPYTCASNAFNNGYGLRVIHPNQKFRARWGLTPRLG